jgi:transcriptional regulator with XRE-family HTH domain
VRQRELGTRLRQLRDKRGLTQEQVAKLLEWSATKISRVETGSRRASTQDVRDLCAVSGVPKPEKELAELAWKAREEGWWTEYQDLSLYPFVYMTKKPSLSRRTRCATYPRCFRRKSMPGQSSGPLTLNERWDRVAVNRWMEVTLSGSSSGGTKTAELSGARYSSAVQGSAELADLDRARTIWPATGIRPRVQRSSEEVRPRVTGSYKRRLAAREREEAERREREEAERREREEAERREREEAERREREEAERRKDWRRTAVKALILGGEIVVTLIREHIFMGTGPGRLL